MRSRASSFKWEYHLLFLRSSPSFSRLLPRLLFTSISPFIFPSITCFRSQFLRKIWPIYLAFRFLISCRIFLCSLTLSNTSSFLTWSVQLIFSIFLQHHISKLYRYIWSAARSFHVSAPYKAIPYKYNTIPYHTIPYKYKCLFTKKSNVLQFLSLKRFFKMSINRVYWKSYSEFLFIK